MINGKRCFNMANCESSVGCEIFGELGVATPIDFIKNHCSNQNPGCIAISCEGPDEYGHCLNHWMESTSCDESTMEDDANWSIYLSNPGSLIHMIDFCNNSLSYLHFEIFSTANFDTFI